jgi:WD40 repeat protein
MHEGGISSIQFKPNDNLQVLSSSVDSSLKVVDLRAGKSIHTLKHSNPSACQLWSGGAFSPDGRYIVSASSSEGTVLIWDTIDHSLKTKLNSSHTVGIVSIDWIRGDDGEQQIASLDRKGSLVLWR